MSVGSSSIKKRMHCLHAHVHTGLRGENWTLCDVIGCTELGQSEERLKEKVEVSSQKGNDELHVTLNLEILNVSTFPSSPFPS